MSDPDLGRRAARLLGEVRAARPLVHNITNFVVMNTTANALLAAGASPVMAHAPEEVEEMVSLAGALVLNIGTLQRDWVDAMLLAGRRAGERGVPIVLDPVGAGATAMRTEAARRLARELPVSVVRGNASEVLALCEEGSRTRGVDSSRSVGEARAAAQALARELGCTVAVTGPVDFVTDGRRSLRVENGHSLMGCVTGMGCTATALTGAFVAVADDRVEGTAAALAFLGLAGETAAARARGPGSFQPELLDALYAVDEEALARGARLETEAV